MAKKKDNSKIQKYKDEVVQVFLKISKNQKLFTEFLSDILTPSEFKSVSLRWQIIKRLSKGETHRFIAKELGIGISTVTRGSRELEDPNGAFSKIFKKSK